MESRLKSLARQLFKWILILTLLPVYYIGTAFVLVALGIYYVIYGFILLLLTGLYGLWFVFELLKFKITRDK